MNNSRKDRANKKGEIPQTNTLFSFSMAEKKVIINLGVPGSFTSRLLHVLIKPLLCLIRFKRFEAWFQTFASDPRPEELVHQKLLDGLNVGVDFNRDQLASIPSEGPLIVVAPHKLVLFDGLTIPSAMWPARKDMKIMTISFLRALPDLRSHLIKVKQGNSKRAQKRNKAAFLKAMTWLKEGHALIVFPSGQISTRKPLWNPHSVESEWSKSIALLIKGSKANVLPVFVHGETSLAYQIAKKIHPWAESLLSPREILAMENQTVRLTIGDPILYDELKTKGSGSTLVDYIRKRTYDLEHPGIENVVSTPGGFE